MQKFSLTNLKTNKVYCFQAEDAKDAIIKMRFKLDMGTFEDSNLQKEYTDTGLEVFRFDILEN